jgi:hypothetical protein
VAGSNCTVSVVTWPGFNAAGKLAPAREKPAPVRVAELMVTGAAPVEVKVTDRVAALFSCTFPKATLAALMLSVGTAAFNCRANVLETLPELAARATACALATCETVAVNPALIAFAGTVTVAGTATAALLLDRLTLSPPLAAAEVSVTVQASVPDPVMDPLLQESALNSVGVEVPVPLRTITAVPLVEELLLMLS